METELRQPAQQSEDAFLVGVREHLEMLQSDANWYLGAAAAEWTTRHAAGRTDAAFATAVGVSRDRVTKARRVVEVFRSCAPVHKHEKTLKWGHYYAAVAWDDAEETLEWAADCEATRAEMLAWHRFKHNEPDPAAQPDLKPSPEPEPPIVTPSSCAPVHKHEPPEPEPDEDENGRKSGVSPTQVRKSDASPPEPLDEPPAAEVEPATDPLEDGPADVNAAIATIQHASSGMDRQQKKDLATALRLVAENLEALPITREEADALLAEFNNWMGVKCRNTNKRFTDLKQRWRSPEWRENYREALQRASSCQFLNGQNDRGWWMDFEFFLRPDTVTKILEGKYDGTGASKQERDQSATLGAIAEAEAYFESVGENGAFENANQIDQGTGGGVGGSAGALSGG